MRVVCRFTSDHGMLGRAEEGAGGGVSGICPGVSGDSVVDVNVLQVMTDQHRALDVES